MACYVGLDASKRLTKICVLGAAGEVLAEGSVTSDPDAIVAFLRGDRRRYARVGIESWSMARWLYTGLARAGLPVVCIEARHAHGILKEMRANKTDRNDARGIAEMLRVGVYRPVHIKSPESHYIHALLTVRRLLLGTTLDLENAVRGVLLSSGLKLATGSRATYEARVDSLVRPRSALAQSVRPLLSLRKHALQELQVCNTDLERLASADPVCRRLMTAPAVGPITALTFRAVIDEPARFRRSRDVGPYVGLTVTIKQSGDRQRLGRISKRGDKVLRSLLYSSARYQLRKHAKPSSLRTWGLEVAARRGKPKALIAIARRLAVTLHRMWVTETDFCWDNLPGAETPA